MKRYFLLGCTLLLAACSTENKDAQTTTDNQKITLGLWRGVIQMQNTELPFNFRISEADSGYQLTLLNAAEQLEAGIIKMYGDSVVMPMHVFDTQITGHIEEDGSIRGEFTKNYTDDYALPFSASPNTTERFAIEAQPKPPKNFNGRWQVNFMGEAGTDTTFNAIGEFTQQDKAITGTFLTPTGDYRYLEGAVYGNKFKMSAFDGEHAFLFTGELDSANTLNGRFYSGKSWQENWKAVRNENAKLPHPDSLTYLKEGYEKLGFSFPNLQGKQVSLDDPRYKDKVVIVQLLGSWCPNCMDETQFLANWHQNNKDEEVEIIGLAYEKKADFDYASQRLKTLKDKLNVGYPLLVAGTADKKEAAKTLPMLNHVLAFPTTIFIDKKGNVRKISTGFSGPGTGRHYEKWVEDFKLFTQKLLQE